MAKKKYRVWEIQIPGQITRRIGADEMQETDAEYVFVADGVTLFKADKSAVRWVQVAPGLVRWAGVKRSKGVSRTAVAVQVGHWFGKRG